MLSLTNVCEVHIVTHVLTECSIVLEIDLPYELRDPQRFYLFNLLVALAGTVSMALTVPALERRKR